MEKTGNLHISGRKKEESFNKKQRLEKEERKGEERIFNHYNSVSAASTPSPLFASSSLLSEDHKAAKILDSRFSSETSDGSLSADRRSLPAAGAGTQLSCSAPHFSFEDELLISLPCNYAQTSRPQKGFQVRLKSTNFSFFVLSSKYAPSRLIAVKIRHIFTLIWLIGFL